MKYCYCPRCKRFRPKTLLLSDTCESCQDKCVIIEVPRSIYGRLMYLADFVAIIILVLYVAHSNYHASFADFIGRMDSNLLLIVLFGLIGASFVLNMIDLGRTNRRAMEIVQSREGRVQ